MLEILLLDTKSYKKLKGGSSNNANINTSIPMDDKINDFILLIVKTLNKLLLPIITLFNIIKFSGKTINDIVWKPYDLSTKGTKVVFGTVPWIGSTMEGIINFGLWLSTLCIWLFVYLTIARNISLSLGIHAKGTEVDKFLMNQVQNGCYLFGLTVSYIKRKYDELDMPGPMKFIEAGYGGYSQLNEEELSKLDQDGITTYIGGKTLGEVKCGIKNLLPEKIKVWTMYLNIHEYFDPDNSCKTYSAVDNSNLSIATTERRKIIDLLLDYNIDIDIMKNHTRVFKQMINDMNIAENTNSYPKNGGANIVKYGSDMDLKENINNLNPLDIFILLMLKGFISSFKMILGGGIKDIK